MKAPLVLLLCLVLPLGCLHAATEEEALAWSPELLELLEEGLSAPDVSIYDESALYRRALIEHEALEPVLERLEKSEDSESAQWLRAKLSWRYGLLDEARSLYEALAVEASSPRASYHVAQLFDAEGQEAKAVEAYQKVLQNKDATDWHDDVRLRLAILKSTGGKVEGELDDLAAYAKGSPDEGMKNRAAVVLALSGKAKEALELYAVDDEDTATRFKHEIRVAEWAMAAKEFKQAQEAGWTALQQAKLRRDRRYALTILAEAYRVEDQLEDLVARFAEASDTLDVESRFTWIGLLRELGQAEEALKLFRANAESGSDGFSVEMRRELLEICRETGQDEVLVQAYREAIASDPQRLEWRVGLSRYFLEQGNSQQGTRVWDGFLQGADSSDVLEAAPQVLALGLQDLAVLYAEHVVNSSESVIPALQFLFDMHRERGRDDEMTKALERMEALAPADSSDRVQLAESWEQMGRPDKAADVLERLRTARGEENFSADLEMRLAWLYSETGDEEKAYRYWHQVWLRVDSPGRRRYVEDRLMATASRLGKLADIAIDLEEKLMEGKADKRDSGLLVRLYTKVGDPVSATEIIEEFLSQTGGSDVQVLEEKAQIYVMCNDYYHYESTLRELMALDPEGKPEYLTQLAMSCLERGKNDEARRILLEMRGLEQNAASAEFEAGVLKIAGLHEEATQAYWRGIAEHQDRIDAYLLLGRSLQTVGKAKQAQGVFQYLVEHADADDLFTIAIDGLLNARVGQPTMRWARRVILERIADRDDKVYLYQLLGDLCEELRDQPMLMRSLSETLPIAGERRTSQLRELVELSKVGVGGSGFSARAGQRAKDRDGLLRYGRRLIGMGEAVPPQVHLDLGQAFLDGEDIRSAEKTFAQAEDLSDYEGFQRKVATSFERKLYVKSALRVYQKLLLGDHADVGLLLKLGELREQLGDDAGAREAYEVVLDQLFTQQPLVSATDQSTPALGTYNYARNQDTFTKYYGRVLRAYLTTASPGPEVGRFLDEQEERLRKDIDRLKGDQASATEGRLRRSPRVYQRAMAMRRIAIGFDLYERVQGLDEILINAFPDDEKLLAELAYSLRQFGARRRAAALVESNANHPSAKAARLAIGNRNAKGNANGDEFLVSLISSDPAMARRRLREAVSEAGEQLGGLQGKLFAGALYLRDARTLRQIARQAILGTPSAQLWNYISILGRVWPYLEDHDRDSLVDLVETKLAGLDESKNTSVHYYIGQLNQLTGRRFYLKPAHVQGALDDMLSRGGPYLGSIGNLFNVLQPEDYQELLKETFAKAKKSDRLPILFRLLRSYEDEVSESLAELFRELVLEAASGRSVDVLEAWNSARRYGYGERDQQLDLIGMILGELAERESDERKMNIVGIQACLLASAGQTEEATKLAKQVHRFDLTHEGALDASVKQQVQRTFMKSHLSALLEVYDDPALVEESKMDRLALARSELALIRQSGNGSRLMAFLEELTEAFPEEKTFHDERRRLLESKGMVWDALQLQKALVEKKPEDASARQQLASLWDKLEHPLKAAEAIKLPEKEVPDKPANAGGDAGAKPAGAEVSQKAAPATSAPPTAGGAVRMTAVVPSTATRAVTPTVTVTAAAAVTAPTVATTEEASAGSVSEEAEKLGPATTGEIKKAAEAEDWVLAKSTLRRIWRQFASLDQSRYGMVMPVRNLGPFQWPRTRTSQPTPAYGGSLQGGLKQFRTKTVVSATPRPSNRSANVVTVFEELGDQPEIIDEIQRALRSLEPNGHRGVVFQREIAALAQARVSSLGLQAALAQANASLRDGKDVSLIERAIDYALLEVATNDEALESDASLSQLVEDLRTQLFQLADAKDLVAIRRLARSLALMGEGATAVPLYHWCAASTPFSPYNYGDGRLSTHALIEDVRQHLEGQDQVRALEGIFELSRPGQMEARIMAPYYMLVLNTWKEVLPAEETLSRTERICEEVLRDFADNPTLTKLASVYLGSGGAAEKGIEALRQSLTAAPMMGPNGMTMVFNSNGTVYYTSGNQRNQSKFTDADLHLFFPKTMDSWKGAGAWLGQLSALMEELAQAEALTPSEAVKVMALTSVSQYDVGDSAGARETLARLRRISGLLPEDQLWVWDAAEHLGEDSVWMSVGMQLWQDREINVHRVASLVEVVAREEGVEEALQLGEEMFTYTAHPELLSACVNWARTVEGASERVDVWERRMAALLGLGSKAKRYGALVEVGHSATLFRQEEMASEEEIRYEVGDLPLVLALNGEGHLRIQDARAQIEGQESRREVPFTLTLVDPWRKANPEGEVYLVSLLERAKTFLVASGAEGWRYHEGNAAPQGHWTGLSYEDEEWKEGSAPLGYGESLVSTTLSYGGDAGNKHPTAYFRRRLPIESRDDLVKLYAGIECDDGSIVYLNGREVYRMNMKPDAPDQHGMWAAGKGERGKVENFFIDPELLLEGDNVIAVSVHQADASSSDLFMDFTLRAVTRDDLVKKGDQKSSGQAD